MEVSTKALVADEMGINVGPVVAATVNHRAWLVVKYRKTLSNNENLILNRAYRTELAPDDRQLQMLHGHAGSARFAYNWGLRWVMNVIEYNQLPHKRLKLPSAIDLHRELNGLKEMEFPWMYEFSKCAPQEALRDLETAFKNFFAHRTGFPRFKDKKRRAGSFRLTGRIRVSPNEIRLPRLGWVRLKERGYLPSGNHINSATVSEHGGKWFVSISVLKEVEDPAPPEGPVVGLDLGVNSLFVVSDGTYVENPKVLNRYERKLKRLQKATMRKQKDSANKKKAADALRRLHYRIANVRSDPIDKATTMLAKTKSVIVVEDLNVKNMMAYHSIAKSIADAAMGEVVRQLEYKTKWYGSRLVVAAKYYPSTKRCSRCGHVKDFVPLDERVYHCEVCGLVTDRDLNAARNLAQWPGVARTLKTPVEGGVQPAYQPVQLPYESGTTSLDRGPRPKMRQASIVLATVTKPG